MPSRPTILLLLAAAAMGCGGEPDDKRELTQREKDSILGASQVPGARAIKRSMTSADSATLRQNRLDSAMQEP